MNRVNRVNWHLLISLLITAAVAAFSINHVLKRQKAEATCEYALLLQAGAGGACDCAKGIPAGDGGNVTVVAASNGKSTQSSARVHVGRGGAIAFKAADADKEEVIRIEADGRVFIHGNKVATDAETYEALLRWINAIGTKR